MWGTECWLSAQPYVANQYVYFELQLLRPQEYLNVGILNGLVVKFKIHILIGNMAVYEFKGVLHKP